MFFLLVFCPDVTGMVDWALARTAGLLWLIRFCHLILVIILAISVVSLFKLDNDTGDLVSVGWEKNDSMFCCAILMQLDLKWKWSGKIHSAKLIYPNRNGMVQYLAVCFHALGPVHWKRGKGGAGICGLAVCQKITMTCNLYFLVLVQNVFLQKQLKILVLT